MTAEPVPGILSTYAASSNREDLAPKPKPRKRKRVAMIWKGRPASENIEDRRNEPHVTLTEIYPGLTAMKSKGDSKIRKYNRTGK